MMIAAEFILESLLLPRFNPNLKLHFAFKMLRAINQLFYIYFRKASAKQALEIYYSVYII